MKFGSAPVQFFLRFFPFTLLYVFVYMSFFLFFFFLHPDKKYVYISSAICFFFSSLLLSLLLRSQFYFSMLFCSMGLVKWNRLFLFSILLGVFVLLLLLLLIATTVWIVDENIVVPVNNSRSFSIAQPRILLWTFTTRFHVSGVSDVRRLCFKWQRTFIR